MSYPKVTVVGAGHVGATTALLLAIKGVADVVLLDVVEGLSQGKALDMMHSRSVERFGPRVTGTTDYADSAGSDVVVVTAGVPRRPGMSRDDLLATNARIVRSVVGATAEKSPDAVVICVTNPLDVMTHLAWSISGMPERRVMGMGGVLDSARFAFAISEATGVDVSDVDALVIGVHGDAMVPLPRLATAAGRPLAELLTSAQVDALVRRTVSGGAEVVALLGTGSAFYAPASSVVAMVEAVLGDTGTVLPSCVMLRGEYGISDVFMSVPAVLGAGGVREVPEIDLSGDEVAALRASAQSVAEGIAALEAAT